MNNLTLCVFGKDVLKTHSITGNPSNNTKNKKTEGNEINTTAKQTLKLDPEKVKLIYGTHFFVKKRMILKIIFVVEIMDSRSFVKKTDKLTKAEKNAIIGKKLVNIKAYKPTGYDDSA